MSALGMIFLIYAHLGHWSGLIAFAVPGVLTIAWAGWTGVRDRRRDRFAEYWTLSRRDGRWTLVAVEPDRKAAGKGKGSPWSGNYAEKKRRPIQSEPREQPVEAPTG